MTSALRDDFTIARSANLFILLRGEREADEEENHLRRSKGFAPLHWLISAISEDRYDESACTPDLVRPESSQSLGIGAVREHREPKPALIGHCRVRSQDAKKCGFLHHESPASRKLSLHTPT